MSERHNRWYSVDEVKTVMAGIAAGMTNRQLGFVLGRTPRSVKGFVGRNGMGRDMTPVCCETCGQRLP